MKHTEGEYNLQEEGEYGMIDKLHILAPDGERVAVINILDDTDVKHAYRIKNLLTAANGITTEQAVAYLEYGKAMEEMLDKAQIILYDSERYNCAREVSALLAIMEVK